MRFDNLSSTKQRFVGTIILIPVALGFAMSPSVAASLLVLLSFLMGWEMGGMSGHSRSRQLALAIVLCGATIPLSWTHLGGQLDIVVALVIAALCIACCTVLAFKNDTGITAILGFLLGLCVVAASGLMASNEGHLQVMILAIAIAACDTTAYFIGRSVGGPKLAPKISPKKTMSGGVAGVAAAVLVMVWFAPFFGANPTDGAVLGLAIGVLAQTGDLVESAVKRALNVKDSGSTIPGHGGVLDRFDGYLLTLPAAYLYSIIVPVSQVS